ncbi:hypothetical protein B9Q04_12010 [Candidatus Marsarchaeota G2 archaeon BE_D]|uniref:AAA domain-containing protein n=1 Tax=Candidatus Marsarchaeota G2 archaeon BE_D TaxID=1978158 RepID=A0A2R6C8N1_9ARCH|nr:MAG: hypothetical protein B9Q04_12010 [Candidatus Marsarchaeota G2 archaeon BE_D]
MFLSIKELSHRVLKENIVYIDFEHERLMGLDAVHLEDMLKVYYELYSPSEKFPIYLFLNEVQNVKDWDKWVRRVQADGRYRIYLTRSSSKLSSREIATSLRGRSVSYTGFSVQF